MLHPHDRRGGDVGLAQRRVIPAVHDVDVVSDLLFRIALEAFEKLGDVALCDLELVRHGDAIVVVPYGEEHRRLKHTGGVDRLPEHPLGTTGVADGAPGDLVAIAREPRRRLQLLDLAIELRGIGQADQARHLRAGRRDVRRGVVAIGLIAEGTVGVEQARCEVAVHRTAARPRIVLDVSARI